MFSLTWLFANISAGNLKSYSPNLVAAQTTEEFQPLKDL